MFKVFVSALVLAGVAADSCTSLSSISHSTTGCVAGEGTPDCAYIQSNQAAICSAILPSWEIVNAPACQLKGSAYGCVFIAGTYSTTDTFCCPLVPAGGGGGASASATVSTTVTVSGTMTVAATVTGTGSGSGSGSGSSTGTWSSSPSVTVSVSSSTYPTMTTSASATGSATAYPSYTSSYSAYPTLTSSTTVNESQPAKMSVELRALTRGERAGISVGVAAGVIFLLYCGAFLGSICRGRRPGDAVNERRPSAIAAVAERRPSAIAAVAERRASTVKRRDSKAALRHSCVPLLRLCKKEISSGMRG